MSLYTYDEILISEKESDVGYGDVVCLSIDGVLSIIDGMTKLNAEEAYLIGRMLINWSEDQRRPTGESSPTGAI